MPTSISWDFYPLVSKSPASLFKIPTLSVSECELNIIWCLAERGPQSIYDLSKRKYYLPEKISTGLFFRKLTEKHRKGIKYHYPFIYNTVKGLRKRNLVQVSKDKSGPRTKNIVSLTFSGLMLYLQGSTHKRKFDYAIKNYPKLFPFSKNIETLAKFLGHERVVEALNIAVKDCVCLRKARFRIRHLQLEFEGFLRSVPLFRKTSHGEVLKSRNQKVVNYLKNEDALELRNSYIGYLAVHDIEKLSGRGKEQVENLIPKLDSEKELAYFENKQVKTNQLFKGDRLKEFFPKYAAIEFFFTGMFVDNLLWTKKYIEKKPRENAFEVEYLI